MGISSRTTVPDQEDPVAELPQCLPGKETILLVEDDQMVRRVARLILEINGHNVLEAASGSEAMEVCKDLHGPVHLLLTDVVMPGMSGPQLCNEVMKMWPDIGILYMSGYADDVIDRHDLQTGAHLLQKPFSPDSLALKVRESLNAARQRRIYSSKPLASDHGVTGD